MRKVLDLFLLLRLARAIDDAIARRRPPSGSTRKTNNCSTHYLYIRAIMIIASIRIKATTVLGTTRHRGLV